MNCLQLTTSLMALSVMSERLEDSDAVLQSEDVHVSFNESLKLVQEAENELENVTRSLEMIREETTRSVERQNEVSHYS